MEDERDEGRRQATPEGRKTLTNMTTTIKRIKELTGSTRLRMTRRGCGGQILMAVDIAPSRILAWKFWVALSPQNLWML